MRTAMKLLTLMSGGVSLDGYIASLAPSLWLDDTTSLWQLSNGTTPAVANADPIGRWDDRSGNNKHVSQATASLRPTRANAAINSLRVSVSDNSSFAELLSGALNGTAWPGVSMIIVCKPLVTEATRGIASFADTATSGSPLILCQRNAGVVRFYVDNGYQFTVNQANNTPMAHIVTCDGTNWNCWLAGVKQTPHVGGLSNLANAQNVYVHDGFSASSASQVGELLLLNYALSDAQVAVLYPLLAAKWGV